MLLSFPDLSGAALSGLLGRRFLVFLLQKTNLKSDTDKHSILIKLSLMQVL